MRISIIGAGPAGAMAAVRLARAGADVSLFDPTHPREKPCGGGLTGRALALVADVLDIAALPLVVATSATVEPPLGTAPHQQPAHVPLIDRGASVDSSLVVVSRAVFDRALVDAAVAAGARLLPEKAMAVIRGRRGMIVRTDRAEYESDHVLGADGPNSLVRKTLASPFTRAQMSTAAGYFVHGVSMSAIALQTIGGQPGYLWSFPRPDHLAVGACAPATHRITAPQLHAHTGAWLDRHGLGGAVLQPYAWPIPSAGYEDATHMTCSGSGWMLLGDAAGLVDPLTREGIFYALLSGAWAAEALVSEPHGRASAAYAGRLRAAVHPELARAARLNALFFHPVFAELFVRGLRESDAIRKVFVDLVGGVQPYRGLRRRLLGTGEWTLAAKAIRLGLFPRFTGTIRAVALPREI